MPETKPKSPEVSMIDPHSITATKNFAAQQIGDNAYVTLLSGDITFGDLRHRVADVAANICSRLWRGTARH
jgi:hypothetical protein